MERYIYSINPEDISVDRAELARRLKVPGGFTNETVEKCIKAVKAVCKPGCCYMKAPVALKCDRADLGFVDIYSRDLCKSLEGCKEVYIMAITLGVDTDRLINRLTLISKAEAFIADAAASAMAEAVIDSMNDYLSSRDKLRPRFSPGYGDLDISYQRDILRALDADKILGIKLGNNLVMTPRKSITAICGIQK